MQTKLFFLLFIFYFPMTIFTVSAAAQTPQENSPTIQLKKKKPRVLSPKTQTEFKQAIFYLNKAQVELAFPLLLKIVTQNPHFRPARYNLAIAYYKQGELGYSVAYWRQLLFENPGDKKSRNALIKVGFKPVFWMNIPVELSLFLLAFSLAILIFLLYKKRYFSLKLWLLPCLLIQGMSAYHFSLRLNSYGTLIDNTPLLNAPQTQSVTLVEGKAGALLQLKKKTKNWTQIQSLNVKNAWVPTDKIIPLKIKVDREK